MAEIIPFPSGRRRRQIIEETSSDDIAIPKSSLRDQLKSMLDEPELDEFYRRGHEILSLRGEIGGETYKIRQEQARSLSLSQAVRVILDASPSDLASHNAYFTAVMERIAFF